MKKFYLALACLLMASWGMAQEEEIMIINPGRETFVHFPSAVLGNQHTLTVFLPEKAVPLSKRYPVVYVLGAGPKNAQEAQDFVEKNHVLAVGIDFTEEDYQNQEQIIEFISRELIPYIDTNYLTFADSSHRGIAAQGKNAALTALALLAKPHLFGAVALASGADAIEQFQLPLSGAPRIFVTGRQSELALAQQKLEQAGLEYGKNFALAYASAAAGLFEGVDWNYLSAPQQDVTLRRLKAEVDCPVLTLDSDEKSILTVTARLNNGATFAYVPDSLRISPPYLSWNPLSGELTPVAGAEPGKVKISGGVDKKAFSVKIKLKKQ